MRGMTTLSAVFLLVSCGGAAMAPSSPPPITSSAPAQASTITRSVVVLSRKAGTDVLRTAADGTMTMTVHVVENGRGPHVDATLRRAPDGTIASFEARGHHTMGTSIAETFTREGRRARWKSLEES